MPVHATKTGNYVPASQLGSGTADSTKYLRGDGSWQVPPGGGGAAWGSITGTLSTQTDLQSALDAKSGTGHNHTGVYQPLATVLTNTTASFTTAQETKLSGIEAGATADMTGAEIVSAINSNLGGTTWQGGGGGGSATTVEVDLGAAKFTGKFTITDAGISGTSKVMAWQAPGPYTGKGTLADEAVMQPVQIIAVIPGSGSAVVHWQTPPIVTMRPIPGAGGQPASAIIPGLKIHKL